MLFRILKKEQCRRFLDKMAEDTEIIAPKQIGVDTKNHPIYQYLPVRSCDEIAFDYDTTAYSAKTYFIPFNERLSTYHFGDDDWKSLYITMIGSVVRTRVNIAGVPSR